MSFFLVYMFKMDSILFLYGFVDCFFFFKQKTAYEMLRSLVGSEMCIRDSGATPGNQLFNDGKAGVAAQNGPDSLQGKLHLNLEILEVFGGQVAPVPVSY